MHDRRHARATAMRLLAAWRGRDAAALTATLHHRAVLTTDGLPAVTEPVRGAGAVATVLLQLTERTAAGMGAADVGTVGEPGPTDLDLAEANGTPAIVLRSAGAVRGVVVLETRRRTVTRLWAVFSPAKLRTWT